MLSIKGMLGPESPVKPKSSPGGEQQFSSPRSSPESQNLREREKGGGGSPRDVQGVEALLAATSAEYASASEEYPTARIRRTLQPLPPQPSQKFRQHSTETNTFLNSSYGSNQQLPMVSDFPQKQSTPGQLPSRKRKASEVVDSSHGSNQQLPMINDSPQNESAPGLPPPRKRRAFGIADSSHRSSQQLPMINDFPQNESTPGPPSSRKRKASEIAGFPAPTPTPTPTVGRQKRAPRPQYTKEQEDFIWFCRDDLSMSWRKVVKLYNDYWHPLEREPHIRSESGLQSRYYRILDFPVKVRKKKEPSRPDLGLIPSTPRRYPWMGVLTDRVDRESGVGSWGTVPVEISVGGVDRGEVRDDDWDDGDMEDEECEGHDEDDNLNEPSTKSTASPDGSDRECSSHPRHPHPLHYNTPTRSSQQTSHLRPSNLLINIDQPNSEGYKSSSSPSPNSTPHQHQSRCTYPRPPDRQAPLGTPLEYIRGPRSSGHVRVPRRKTIRHRERLDGEGEGKGETTRERERRPETRRVDSRLSVTSLCV